MLFGEDRSHSYKVLPVFSTFVEKSWQTPYFCLEALANSDQPSTLTPPEAKLKTGAIDSNAYPLLTKTWQLHLGSPKLHTLKAAASGRREAKRYRNHACLPWHGSGSFGRQRRGLRGRFASGALYESCQIFAVFNLHLTGRQGFVRMELSSLVARGMPSLLGAGSSVPYLAQPWATKGFACLLSLLMYLRPTPGDQVCRRWFAYDCIRGTQMRSPTNTNPR